MPQPEENDSLVIQTRAKWPIPNDIRPELSRRELQHWVEFWHRRFPDIRLRSIANVYNCMGLVVACRRVWAYPKDLRKILTDDGCRQLAGPHETEPGDVVICHDEDGEPQHVGIVFYREMLVPGGNDDPITLLSKWGGMGEYLHKSKQVPEVYGRAAEFWTDRRMP